MILRLVLVAEVVFMCILLSFMDKQHYGARPPSWTLTREAILTLRATAGEPDHCTRLYIASLGCAARRRGCRGGQRKVKLKPGHYSLIPVVIGNRLNSSHAVSPVEKRRRFLTNVRRQQPSHADDAPASKTVEQCERRDVILSTTRPIDLQTPITRNGSRSPLSSFPPLYVIELMSPLSPRHTLRGNILIVLSASAASRCFDKTERGGRAEESPCTRGLLSERLFGLHPLTTAYTNYCGCRSAKMFLWEHYTTLRGRHIKLKNY